MTTYKNITKPGSSYLVPHTSKARREEGDGEVESIHISNNSVNDATVSVYLEDTVNVSPLYFVKNIVIPTKVAFILDNNVSFSITRYTLKVSTEDVNPDLTVIVKKK